MAGPGFDMKGGPSVLTHIEVHSPRTDIDELTFSIQNADTDTIQIRNIVGLEPVKASVNTTPFGSGDGESHDGSSVGKRNIVFTLGLNPNWVDQSIESLRTLLYAYFTPKLGVTLKFFSDIRVPCEIFGLVESCEPSIFSKDPEMQVSIICPKPFFIGVAPIVVQGEIKSDVEVIAEFLDTEDATEINYEGTVPTEFKLRLTPSAGVPSYTGHFVIVNKTPELIPVWFETTVDGTQDVEFSSIKGQKYLRLDTAGIYENILHLAYNPIGTFRWAQFQPGINLFGVVSNTEGQEWILEYFDRFGGL